MKVTLVVLGFACFVGALNAFPLEETNESELVPQVLPNFEEKDPEGFPLEEVEIAAETFPNFDEAFELNKQTPRPPQIHDNNVKFQAPFAGSLINIVSNDNGMQETMQKNRIQYNFNDIKKTLEVIKHNE